MSYQCEFLKECLDADQLALQGEVLEDHAGDVGTPEDLERPPDAVVWPESTEDVARILEQANDRDVPVTPYAAATSVEGQAAPVVGGISMDMTRMNEVLEVRPSDFQVDVQPGIIGTEINDTVGSEGLFFPPLPSSGDISTIGGMIATDASGMQTVKYGEVADWVLELEAVLADGSVITAGSKTMKTSVGYNLKDLIVGSEGTLAIVTRATLQLTGLPEQIRGGRAVFDDIDDAAAAVSDAIQSGLDIAKLELIDAFSASVANRYLDSDLPDAPMVFFEFHANHGIKDEISFCRMIFESHDVHSINIGTEAELDVLWEIRRELPMSIGSYLQDEGLYPVYPGDVTVPISKYPDVVKYAMQLGAEHPVKIPCYGHAGDGNLHYLVLVEETADDMQALGERLYDDIVEYAIEIGGTASGEHGIGLGKRKFLEMETGVATVDAMRAVKRAFDPNDILNPSKMFPETEDQSRVSFAGDE